MGFEIKNICSVVPNAHHPKAADDYYYFSVFITPRLQFDGTLKEFYEMRHWPVYAERIFWNWVTATGTKKLSDSITVDGDMSFVSLAGDTNDKIFPVEKDFYYINELCKQMEIKQETDESSLSSDEVMEFLKKAKNAWYKLFNETMPVEAWPIYISPHEDSPVIAAINKEIEEKRATIEKLQSEKDSLQKRPVVDLANGIIIPGANPAKTRLDTVTDNLEKTKYEKTQLENNLKDEQKKAANQKQEQTKFRQEFHKKVSALARYPHILRIMGFIQDFKVRKVNLDTQLASSPTSIPLKLKIDLQLLKLQNENELYPFEEFKKSVQFIRPFTKCSICNEKDEATTFKNIKNRLRAYYYADNKENYADYVSDGYLKVKLANGNYLFEVDQTYFEDQSSAFKNEVQTRDAQTSGAIQVVGINTKVFKDDEVEILKQKITDQQGISKGFSIKVKSHPADLLTNMPEQLKTLTNENIEDVSSAFMAHHLDCGYRVDVSISKAGKRGDFFSLCKRKARYIVDRKEQKLFSMLCDEPWLEEVRMVEEDGKESRFEEITRWNGWSLTCPPLYANKTEPNSESDDLELRDIKPVDLPRLRFGHQYNYSFLIRTVDICGNGAALNKDFSETSCILSSRAPVPDGVEKQSSTINYTRREPLGSPLFFPTEVFLTNIDKDSNDKKKIKPHFKGEDNETLVIRTTVSPDGDNKPINETCVRFVTPQYVTPAFAEISGQIDDAQIPTKKKYDYLKAIPQHAYEEDEIMKGIPFAVDNLVTEIRIMYSDQSLIGAVPVDAATDLPKRLPSKFVLGQDKFIIYNENEEKKVELNMGKGEYRSLLIQSAGKGLKDSAAKTFRLIHAVQRPYLASIKPIQIDDAYYFDLSRQFQFGRKNLKVDVNLDRQPYQVQLNIGASTDLNSIFPFSTTGEFILTATYKDYELNHLHPAGWSWKTSAKGKKDPEIFFIRKSWSNLDESTADDRLDTILTDTPDIKKIDTAFLNFQHEYPDTKYRKVNYILEAVSKFSEYFDADNLKIEGSDKSLFSVFALLDKDQKGGGRYTTIKNSAKPSKPAVTSIVPVFTIREGKTNFDFKHNTFRVYLGKHWYETGLDESIAVVYPGLNPTNEDAATKNKYSFVAKDPTVSTDTLIYKDSTNHYIDSTRLGDLLDISLLNKTLDSLKADSATNGGAPVPSPTKSASSDSFSVFKVYWDMAHQEFYADIIVQEDQLIYYSTLIKFGICRYQENSLVSAERGYDFRFSDVVMTDMQVMLPGRSVDIANKKIKYEIAGSRGLPNSFYLIAENNDKLKDGVSRIAIEKAGWDLMIGLIENKDFSNVNIGGKWYAADNILKQAGRVFIEEYENIPVAEKEASYLPISNPRSDPAKRLVFFCQIK